MPINFADEEVLTLTQASRVLPRRNGNEPARHHFSVS